MALEKLTPVPVNQPFDINGRPNPAWVQLLVRLVRILGGASGTAVLDISGEAATAAVADSIPVIQAAGVPEGMQEADQGVVYVDTDTSTTYVKSTQGGNDGWIQQ